MAPNNDCDYVEHLGGLKRMQEVNKCYLKQLRERKNVLNRELEYCDIWEEEAEDFAYRMNSKIARVQKQYDATGNPFENAKGISDEVYNLFENKVSEAKNDLERYVAAKRHKGLLHPMTFNLEKAPDYWLLFSKNPYESIISKEADISKLRENQAAKRRELNVKFHDLPYGEDSEMQEPSPKRTKIKNEIKEEDIIQLD